MESVHGVDVSWLHRPNKDHPRRSRAPSAPPAPSNATNPPLSHDIPSIPLTPTISLQSQPSHDPSTPSSLSNEPTNQGSPNPALANDPSTVRQSPRRPSLLNRSSVEKMNGDNKGGSRKGSWISNISSKFSGSQQPPQASPTVQTSKPQVNGGQSTSSPQTARAQMADQVWAQNGQTKEAEELHPYVPQKPKESTSSFFSNLTRRLSTSSQTGPPGKVAENGGVCARRVMNVDRNRIRCHLPELDSAKLRRVSFSVDVEIAGGPRYKDEDPVADKQKKTKDKKLKERAEGETLKHPEAVTDIKEGDNKPPVEDVIARETSVSDEATGGDATDDARDEPEGKEMSHKKEKKKRSEEERKDRKEKRRRKAEESGSVPVEVIRDKESSKEQSATSTAQPPGSTSPKAQDRPTTDPVRIYRRCCQLRESPILKRITEQLMSPNCTVPGDPGTVTCLNLKGSRLQLADVFTLGDWLAVVPVRRLILEDADLTDEGVRVILAGLLASKNPQPTILTRINSRDNPGQPPEDRSGVVEKLILKNNPRITNIGWKHIALFLYMCRSIKAIDLSMIQFPEELSPSAQVTSVKAPERAPNTTGNPVDAADIFSKAIAERLAGSRLEELSLSECGLSTQQMRKILDAATTCGVNRLGLAGLNMDEESFEFVLKYVRSGVCTALDIGSSDLRGKLGRLAEALTARPDCPVWGLSLAFCELDTEALQPLFPALVALPSFRFIDLSHNTHLFENGAAGGVQLLRKYIPRLRNLKRIHLIDVGLSTKQTIALAEVLPEGPSLAHLSILENAELSALVTRTDESSQEEACALYASLMAAVRVSSTIICIDVDVPGPEHNEVVRALAKQVVAYCLRNMERLPLAEGSNTTASEFETNDVTVPDVLMHLVGHVEGYAENHDNDDPAPDDDYIVGGTGVVKALQYCLGEKAQDLRRVSNAVPGVTTPKDEGSMSFDMEKKGKAKDMSKNLLGSARKIRARLQPALNKEASAGDELAYRRLLFLDQTLQGMIQRFEDEYPETRLVSASPRPAASLSSSLESAPLSDATGLANSVATLHTEASALSNDSDEEDFAFQSRPSRKNSDVNIASRALAQEEGRFHRLGMNIRRDILNASPGPGTPSRRGSTADDGSEKPELDSHLTELAKRLENLSGNEVKDIVDRDGWDGVMKKIHANVEDLQSLQMSDPIGWEQFKESQLKALANT